MTGFPGVNVAAITPRGKQGEVDLGASFELIDHLCAARVRGIALFGESGEYPAFNFDERSRLVYLAVKRSRVPVLVGVGSATLELSVALARESRDAGAAAIVIPPPFFFRYQAEDLGEFFRRFAAQVGSGIAMYLANTPDYTSAIPTGTALELLESGSFAGIVDASGDVESFQLLKAHTDRGAFHVMSGADELFAQARCLGEGTISAAACAVPELLLALDRAIAASRREEMAQLEAVLRQFLDWVARFPQPTIVKVATGLRGLKTGALPIPLSPAREKLLGEFREWFQSWLPAVKKMSANV